MNQQDALQNLISKLQATNDEGSQLAIAYQLKSFGDRAVALIAPRLLTLDLLFNELSEPYHDQKRAYLIALEVIATRRAYQTLLQAMFVYDDDAIYWDELLNTVDNNAMYMVEDLSNAVVSAQGRSSLQMNLLLALTYGLECVSEIPDTVSQNILTVYKQADIISITYLYPVVALIVKQSQAIRFLQPTLRLLSSQESDLRWMAIEVLSEYDSEHIILEIAPMLRDENELVRLKAKEALIKAGIYKE